MGDGLENLLTNPLPEFHHPLLMTRGIAFGIYRDNLIVRLGSDGDARKAIEAGKAGPFGITGRTMKGWVMIPKAKLRSREQHNRWIERGPAFARSLPAK
ncbi:MAG: hypothetical protein AB1512_09650 [Thermodesulfobacteriota bacterium]